MIFQCLIIFACLAVGEVIVMLTGIKFPSSIIGMLLLCALLKIGMVKYDKIKGMANVLNTDVAEPFSLQWMRTIRNALNILIKSKLDSLFIKVKI